MTSTDPALGAVETFPPHVLREYALLADGERGALVGPRGDVVWMCAPRWDSDGVFSSLIGGCGSLIWRNRWITETGIVECREALAFPGDPHRVIRLRRSIAVQGAARVHIVVEPAAEFGRQCLRELRRDDDGRWEGLVGGLRARWTGGGAAHVHGEDQRARSLRATLTLPEASHHDLILEISGSRLDPEPPDADRLWKATTTAWREAMPNLGASIATRDARHSYAVLRGLICAAGLRAMATAGASAMDAAVWSGLADTIVADAASDCVHPTGRWQRACDDPSVDAALLLPAIRGALPATDPRSVATVAAVRAEPGKDGYVYRFRKDARPPGAAEGAFTLCGFLALAEHQQGDALAARTWFERNRAACGPPGLFSEEYDVTQRQLRGNLPQAFVHALMVEAAVPLS
jgi:hypothetical protein